MRTNKNIVESIPVPRGQEQIFSSIQKTFNVYDHESI